jgi:DNA-directed RNA polymerase subunit RPC12/RpoP
MFIVCPSCSGPYSIPADQIAPLVQVACPHCEYRIILDFEAANDPSLREPGHQFAQGYESAEAYFSVYSHVTKNPDAKPFVRPGRRRSRPPAAAEIKTSRRRHDQPPHHPRTPPSRRRRRRHSTDPAELAAAQPPRQQPAGSSRNAKTVIHTGSKKPVPLDPASSRWPRGPSSPSGTDHARRPGTEKLPEAPPPSITPATVPPTSPVEPERRNPPHTPAGLQRQQRPAAGSETKPEDPAAQSHSQLGEKKPDVKPVETPVDKMPEAIKPVETSSAKYIVIGIVLLIVVVVGDAAAQQALTASPPTASPGPRRLRLDPSTLGFAWTLTASPGP